MIDPPCRCTPFSCGITDAFNRTVVGSGGTSDAGIAWVIQNFNAPSPSGLSYGVAPSSLTVTAVDVSVEWGSIELPLTGMDSFLARFVFHDYPATGFEYIDLQTPASGAAASASLNVNANLLEATGSVHHTVPFVFDGRPVNVVVYYGSQVKVKAWYDGDAEPGWMVTAPVGDRTLPAAFVLEFDGFQTNGDTASISALEISQSSVRELADLFARTVAAGGWGTSPEGFVWTAYTHPAGLSVTGAEGEMLSAGSATSAYISDAAGPWNATSYHGNIVFEVRDAPVAPALSRVTDFNVVVGSYTIQLQIAATQGPPNTGFPKAYLQLSDGVTDPLTYIDPTFWVAGGVYTLDFLVAGSTASVSVTDGFDRYEVIGDATYRVDRLFLENAYFGPGGSDQLIKVRDIHIDPVLANLDRCSAAGTAQAPVCNQPVRDERVGVGDGTTTDYATLFAYISGSLQVEVSGMLSDVTQLDLRIGTFRLVSAPPVGAPIRASYRAQGV